MAIKSPKSMVVTILKGISLIILGIVAIVGSNAHFNAETKHILESSIPDTPDFPSSALLLEIFFVAVVITFLVLSALNIIASLSVDITPFRIWDAMFHVIGAIFLLIVGCFMITAAIHTDQYQYKGVMDFFLSHAINKEEMIEAVQEKLRIKGKYLDKMIVGTLTILNSVLLLAIGIIILLLKKKDGRIPSEERITFKGSAQHDEDASCENNEDDNMRDTNLIDVYQ